MKTLKLKWSVPEKHTLTEHTVVFFSVWDQNISLNYHVYTFMHVLCIRTTWNSYSCLTDARLDWANNLNKIFKTASRLLTEYSQRFYMQIKGHSLNVLNN